ncbi:hypothetical protein D3C78_1347170 [compost metagenome]
MRMPSTTARQVLLTELSEGMSHVARRTASVAFDPQVLGLEGCATLEETQRAFAIVGATVDEPLPRKIIQMPILASQKETRRNGIGILRRLISLRTATALMHETSRLRTAIPFFQLEQPAVVRREQPAFHTAQPARERPYRHTDIRFRRVRVVRLALADRRHT